MFAFYYINNLQSSKKLDLEIESELKVISDKLSYELGRYKILPKVIAGDVSLQNFLTNSDQRSSIRVNQISRLLEEHSVNTGSNVIYLLDNNGLTVATSNWRQEDSFLGESYDFRPYYKEAILGQDASYFALGTQSGKRGFYFASPVKKSGEIVGVAVVKVSLSTIEEHQLIHKNFEYALSDMRGVFFFSSNETWNYKTIVDLPSDVEQEIIRQKQFGTGPIETLSSSKSIGDAINRDSIELPLNGVSTPFLFKVFTVQDERWRIFVFAPKSLQQRYWHIALVLGTLVFLLLCIFFLYLKSTRETEKVLLKSKSELEERVEQRTLQLSQTNRVLEGTIEKYQETEASLKQTQGELIQAEKLAVLGEMSAGINHELNQPLTAMQSYAETGLKLLDHQKPEAARENLSLILRLTKDMANIVKKFKVFSRKSEFKNNAVSAEQIAMEALQVLHNQVKDKNIEVLFHSEPNLPHVAADSTLLEQVFVNLIFNSVQAVEDNVKGEVSVDISHSGSGVLISISDNGRGLNDQTLSKIFEPFFTTKKKGLGLGLTLSKRIIELFGGSIVASNTLKGARFDIILNAYKNNSGNLSL